MAEEYDPLDKLATGNAYDALVAGRMKKIKKAAAVGGVPVAVGVFFLVRLIVAALNAGGSAKPDDKDIEEVRQALNALQRPRDADRNMFPREVRIFVLRKRIDQERELFAADIRGTPLHTLRKQRLEELEAELKQLEAQAAPAPKLPIQAADPNFVGPPKELMERQRDEKKRD